MEVEIEQKDIKYFKEPHGIEINIEGLENSLKSQTTPIFSDGKKFLVNIPVSSPDLLLGMIVNINL